ncbi:MAG: FGGY-family carbohydrate kinase [Acidimicrobiia bacterium]|nr:FGGY-family carbohydrate kinase [Acidimicrobiia bacterium]
MSILVVDIGTSSVRALVVRPDASLDAETAQPLLPNTPAPGLVEFDANAMADAILSVAEASLSRAGPVEGVGIANQRASTIVWDRTTGEPVGPGLGWQDLRTVGECLVHQANGLRFAPNESATKAELLWNQADPDRARELLFGTVDTWAAWVLSAGSLHVTDATNAGLTGLYSPTAEGWSSTVLDALSIPAEAMPTVVDSTGVAGTADALEGAPPIAGIAGDQQASLIGQGCVRPGQAKCTFGTGGMLDLVLGPDRPDIDKRSPHGTFPVITWRRDGEVTWGLEAVMLAAGTNVEWLRDDLGLIDTATASHDLAASCDDTDGVVFVPDLLGAGTPEWDFGARGGLFGLTRGTEARHVTRAVLEGVAMRARDLLDAIEADAGRPVERLRIDGGMSENPTFAQAVADAMGRPIELAPVKEATALGAGFLAGMAVGTWQGWDDVADAWAPRATVEPATEPDRDRWRRAVERAGQWHGDLSALDF